MESLLNLSYYMPTKIIFGTGKLDVIGEEVASLGKKALLVTGKHSAKSHGFTQRVVDRLKEYRVETVVFDEIESNPSNTTVNRGGKLAQGEQCDVIIGLGGGSAMDAAKGISVVAVESHDVWDIVEGATIENEILPIIAIPTTAGTGSEVTPYCVISNPEIHRKDAFASPKVFPKVAILDPLLTVTLPPYHTASSGMDALAQAIEAYTSVFASPISDLFAIEAIRLAAQNLRKAVSNGEDLLARTNMLFANTLAGIAIAQADTTIAHVVGEAVGAVYNTDHGTSVALSLPAVMEHNFVSNLEKYANITRLLGEWRDTYSLREAAQKSADAISVLIKDVGLPSGLSEIGVDDLDPVMELVMRPGLTASNPKSVTEEDFMSIITKSL